MKVATVRESGICWEAGHIADIRLASSKMTGAPRRAFQAQMVLQYCGGNPRRAEDLFGWSRQAVQLGLHEKRCGIVCIGHQRFSCGAKLWEEKHPEAASALWEIAQSHSQQDPSFRTTICFTRLSAEQAIAQLRARGFAEAVLPSRSGMSNVLNRNGYRLRPVLKAKPQKNVPKPTPSSPTSKHTSAPAKAKPLCA